MHRLVDVSRYQVERSDPLDLAAAQSAGYSIANIALTGGRGYVSGAWARTYVVRARQLNMGVCTYHWLDGRTSGAEQAAATTARLRSLFGDGPAGFGHVVDVEEDGAHGVAPPTWEHVRTYVDAIQQALGRPMAVYTADYWWKPRGWDGASLTPYLMGPPNDPVDGDDTADSPGWTAGWGGWPTRRIMQWAVRPLPGTGDCSLSVIRHDEHWTSLTGGSMAWELVPAGVALRADFNAVAPGRDKASDGSVGDLAHQQSSSDHNPDETGNVPVRDADSTNEVHAIDVDMTGPWPAGWSMERFVQFLLAECRAGRERRIRYIIFNRRIWSASISWVQQNYTGGNPHDKHAHFSLSYTTSLEQDDSPYGLKEAVDGMPLTNADADVIWNRDTIKNPKQRADSATNADTAAEFAIGDMWQLIYNLRDAVASLRTSNDAQTAALLQAIGSLPAAVAAELGEIPGVDPATLEAAVGRAVAGVLANIDVVYTPPA